MRIRHRIPSVFNLSMVDVLCCALGCVILLWLLNLRDAKERAEAVGRTESELVRSRAESDALALSVAKEREQHRLASDRALVAETERDRLRSALASAQSAVKEQEKTLAALRADKIVAEDRLVKKT